jgi:hypothetical protein
MMRLPIILTLALAGSAAAEPAPSTTATTQATYDMGFRVGGYGFKREGDSRPGAGWTECRMNGVGVFASRVLRGPLFVEAGLDLYTSADFPLPADSMDLPIDRMSGLVGISGGARTNLTSRLRGYVQLGGGVELTRVAVPYGEDETIRDTKTMPAGFLGVGMDIRVGGKTHIGATFRTLMMGNFNYKRSELEQRDDWGFIAPDKEVVFDASLDFAAQGQFYLRRDL